MASGGRLTRSGSTMGSRGTPSRSAAQLHAVEADVRCSISVCRAARVDRVVGGDGDRRGQARGLERPARGAVRDQLATSRFCRAACGLVPGDHLLHRERSARRRTSSPAANRPLSPAQPATLKTNGAARRRQLEPGGRSARPQRDGTSRGGAGGERSTRPRSGARADGDRAMRPRAGARARSLRACPGAGTPRLAALARAGDAHLGERRQARTGARRAARAARGRLPVRRPVRQPPLGAGLPRVASSSLSAVGASSSVTRRAQRAVPAELRERREPARGSRRRARGRTATAPPAPPAAPRARPRCRGRARRSSVLSVLIRSAASSGPSAGPARGRRRACPERRRPEAAGSGSASRLRARRRARRARPARRGRPASAGSPARTSSSRPSRAAAVSSSAARLRAG